MIFPWRCLGYKLFLLLTFGIILAGNSALASLAVCGLRRHSVSKKIKSGRMLQWRYVGSLDLMQLWRCDVEFPTTLVIHSFPCAMFWCNVTNAMRKKITEHDTVYTPYSSSLSRYFQFSDDGVPIDVEGWLTRKRCRGFLEGSPTPEVGHSSCIVFFLGGY